MKASLITWLNHRIADDISVSSGKDVIRGCLAVYLCYGQAMVGADQWFMKEAEASTRAGATWEFAAVRNSLQVRQTQ